jgi:hypothetical protein
VIGVAVVFFLLGCFLGSSIPTNLPHQAWVSVSRLPATISATVTSLTPQARETAARYLPEPRRRGAAPKVVVQITCPCTSSLPNQTEPSGATIRYAPWYLSARGWASAALQCQEGEANFLCSTKQWAVR